MPNLNQYWLLRFRDDNNFTGLSAFTVSIDILSGSSAGESRHRGISVGQSKTDLDGCAGVSPSGSDADFFIGYDNIGSTTGLQVFHNGSNQGFLGSPTLSSPDTLSVDFTFADMNAGTALNYAVSLNGISVGSGSTAWSGTDENCIAIQSNYTGYSYFDNFEVIPEPGTMGLVAIAFAGLFGLRRRFIRKRDK